jgi:4-hydroxybenzoate polyprenyltransferase
MIKIFGWHIPYPIKLPGYLDILRPYMSLLAGVTTFLSMKLVNGSNRYLLNQTVLLAISTIFLFSSSMVINDYLDLEEDMINDPNKAITSGKIGKKTALAYGISLFIIGIFTSFIVDPFLIVYGTIFLLCNVSYSKWLKKRIVIGNLYTGLYSSYAILIVALYTHEFLRLSYFILYAILFIFGREILRTASDTEGDLRVGIKTISNSSGEEVAIFIGSIIMILSMLLYFTDVYTFDKNNPIFTSGTIISMFLLIITGMKAWQNATKHKIRLIADLSSLIMFFMVFAFTLR